MNNKKLCSVLFGILVLAAAVGLAKMQADSKKNSQPRPNNYNLPSVESSDATTTSKTASTTASSSGKTADLQKKVVAPDTSVQDSGPKTYTLAEVQKHNNQNDCWSVINGSVYDFTPWVSKHPGGSKAIIRICGRDGSDDFNEQHSGDGRVAKVVATFKIGNLK